MNEPKRRRSKAERGLELIQQASFGVKLLADYELKRIARAINPQFQDYSGSLLVFDDVSWVDNSMEPQLDCLARHWLGYLWNMRTALVFFREMVRSRESGRLKHDVRLVFEFPHEEGKHGRVWLDCETGLPWVPVACQKMRRLFNAEEIAEKDRRDAEILAKARAAIRELRKPVVYPETKLQPEVLEEVAA